MRILGYSITKADPPEAARPLAADSGSGWRTIIGEAFSGAWQRNVEINVDTVLTNSAVFSCVSLISGDISKMRVRLMEQDPTSQVWRETVSTAYSPVLRKPNSHQNRIQFYASWLESKLTSGNTYVLKQRDNRGVVVALYVLDPNRVRAMVTPGGDIYYQLRADNLAGLEDETIMVPAREIIHDRWNTLHHPLVGLSPITACGLSAIQGLRIQHNSARFFGNDSRPNGIVTAPGNIPNDKITQLRDAWEDMYGGRNLGRVAILGNGMTYQAIAMTALDSQLIEQLKWSAETVAGVYRVPAHKIGVGPPPSYNNIEGLNLQYYSQCLQVHIEAIELLLDEGLELRSGLGTSFDLQGLLRMDSNALMKVSSDGTRAGIFSPNEARARHDLPPTPGGEVPYMQQQNWPLQMLADRELPAVGAAQPPALPAPGGDGGDDDMPPDDDEPDENAVRAQVARMIDHASQRHLARDLVG